MPVGDIDDGDVGRREVGLLGGKGSIGAVHIEGQPAIGVGRVELKKGAPQRESPGANDEAMAGLVRAVGPVRQPVLEALPHRGGSGYYPDMALT